jgi:hypothetical protein
MNAHKARECWLIVACVLCLAVPTRTALGAEQAHPTSTVVRLKHLAVILPELDETRRMWECKLWTPTIKQVVAAEKAILRRIEKFPKVEGTMTRKDAHYIIQYYGLILDGRKWIACSIVDIQLLIGDAAESNAEHMVSTTVTGLFTAVFDVKDSDYFSDAFYDPATDRLSESMGFLTAEPEDKSKSKKEGRNATSAKPSEKQPENPFAVDPSDENVAKEIAKPKKDTGTKGSDK